MSEWIQVCEVTMPGWYEMRPRGRPPQFLFFWDGSTWSYGDGQRTPVPDGWICRLVASVRPAGRGYGAARGRATNRPAT